MPRRLASLEQNRSLCVFNSNKHSSQVVFRPSSVFLPITAASRVLTAGCDDARVGSRYFEPASISLNSVRRLVARPEEVELSAMGRSLP